MSPRESTREVCERLAKTRGKHPQLTDAEIRRSTETAMRLAGAGVAHDHTTFVAGCFRCELSRDEVADSSAAKETP